MNRMTNHGRFKMKATITSPNDTNTSERMRAPVFRRAFPLLLSPIILLSAVAGCTTVRAQRAEDHIQRGDRCLAEKKFESALAEFQAAAEIAPRMAIAHSRLGVVYQQLGEYTQAIESFVEAIRINPFSFDETFKLAQLYYFLHRVPESIQAYLHAVELKPTDFKARLSGYG